MDFASLQLCDLPPVLLAHALEFADVRMLLALECTSVALQQLIRDFHIWRSLMHQISVLAPRSGSSDTMSAQRWKRLVRLVRLAAQPARGEASLLEAIRACSSVDNPGESPSNTLARSSCEVNVGLLARSVLASEPMMLLEWARRIQLRCGCARGRPCYWSTAASWKHTEQDVLEYAMRRNCVVSSVCVAPYRVFWYPDHPTYSPLQLSFSFHELLDDTSGDRGEQQQMTEMMEVDDGGADVSVTTVGPAIFESPVYDVIRDMKVQEFALSRAVFLCRGVMRLHLFGRQQDLGADMMAWNRENNMPPYYICLSYVGATGRELDE